MTQRHILAIDQGTTSSRAILFNDRFEEVASAQREFAQIYPQDGWVEHDAMVIWRDVLDLCREVLAALPKGNEVAGIGITNQRETTVLWNRKTGEPVANAIVWQDRRTAETCETLRDEGWLSRIQTKTGLLLDPYFSGTKLAWLLDRVDGARDRAERGSWPLGPLIAGSSGTLPKGRAMSPMRPMRRERCSLILPIRSGMKTFWAGSIFPRTSCRKSLIVLQSLALPVTLFWTARFRFWVLQETSRQPRWAMPASHGG